jgi:hypothetical protein
MSWNSNSGSFGTPLVLHRGSYHGTDRELAWWSVRENPASRSEAVMLYYTVHVVSHIMYRFMVHIILLAEFISGFEEK